MPNASSPRGRRSAALALAAVLASLSVRAAPPSCDAGLEVAALRARVAELETQLAARPAPAAVSVASPTLPEARTIITRDGTAIRAIPLPSAPEEPYSRTGCSLGFFKGAPPGRWQDPNGWEGLARGQTPAQVEAALGVEHHDVGQGARRLWEYGKCGERVAGRVLFVNGAVEDWRAPENLR